MSEKLSFEERAELSTENPLKGYLLHLISIKQTNLCVSADVHSTTALLRLAEEVGDHICVLKTHADIIDDFGERTIKGLRELSKSKRFLIFEDRKFGDIGSTVLAQYTRGPLAIASWAHLVNAHIFPGPAVVKSLKIGAASAVQSLKKCVSTEISVGTPQLSENDEDFDDDEVEAFVSRGKRRAQSDAEIGGVKTTTTIYQTVEQPVERRTGGGGPSSGVVDSDALFERIGDPPLGRGLLLFAQMSSEANLMDEDYTQKCVDIALDNKDFVAGFISQRSLNEDEDDNFLSFTPGINLPPENELAEARRKTDGMGQRYRTPREVIQKDGCDIIIVGRAIVGAKNRAKEAERFKLEAWKAYQARIGAAA